MSSLVVTRAGGGAARGDASSLRQLLGGLVAVRSRAGRAGGQRSACGSGGPRAGSCPGDAAAGGGPGRLMLDLAEHHDGVQGSVQLPVPAPVAAMADHLARGGRHRGAPASMENAASERNRPGSDQLISSWAAWAKGLHGDAVFHRIARGGDQPGAARSCWRQGRPAGCRAAARGGDDQGLPAGGGHPPRRPRHLPG